MIKIISIIHGKDQLVLIDQNNVFYKLDFDTDAVNYVKEHIKEFTERNGLLIDEKIIDEKRQKTITLEYNLVLKPKPKPRKKVKHSTNKKFSLFNILKKIFAKKKRPSVKDRVVFLGSQPLTDRSVKELKELRDKSKKSLKQLGLTDEQLKKFYDYTNTKPRKSRKRVV